MSTVLRRRAPPRPAPPAPRRAPRWDGVPRGGDPRVPFAAILTVYAVLGTLWLGFNRSPSQIALTVAAGCGLDLLLHRVLRGRLVFPLSAYITSLSLAILLNYAHDHFLLFLPVFLAIGSKYLLTYRGRHVFNPSLFGVATTLLLAGNLITAAPAYQWGGGWGMSIFIVTAALVLFVFRVRRGWLISSFLVFYALQTALRAYLLRAHLPPEMLFLGTMETPPFYLFVFFMLTDPKTSPESRRGQVAVAFAITVVDLYLHTKQSVFTFFYAAFAVASAKFLWLHGRTMLREGSLFYLRAHLASPRLVGTVAVLGGLLASGMAGYLHLIRPRAVVRDAGFRFEEVSAAWGGLELEVDPRALDLVDPRLRHIAKWLLSVGSSAAAADVNNDGLIDFFFTTPLGTPASRTALYLNRRRWRFERRPIPALDVFLGDPARNGLPSGAIFFDSDSDGDQDLLLLVSFGTTRLLRNLLVETGSLEFEDISERAGLTHYTTSVAANVLDFERDGDADLLIGNVLPEYLPGYATPTRLNIFRLPQPEYAGDRRMFRFMHNGWHNARNGGKNLLLRNRGDGTFETLDIDAMGMPETHWTLAVGTGDLNGDGWTDLYLASDFGRDDLYLNQGGRHFRRIAGRLFGDVGMDTYKGMNSSVADFDRNGWLDIYVSNVHHALQAEGSLLWMNRGVDRDGTPRLYDEAMGRGALNESRFGWGAAVGDFDHNGWVDILQANGMVDDRLDRLYPRCPDYWYVNHKLMQSGPEIHTYADMWGDLRGRCIYPDEARRVYLNRGTATRPQFVDAAQAVGLTARDNSRGIAVADVDNDGWLDAVISNQHGRPTLLRNVPTRSGAGRVWIGLRLAGDGERCTRDAIGSTTVVRVPGQPVQVREVQGANGFSSQHDTRLHFGLGTEAPADVPIAIRWCGRPERQYRLRANEYHELTQ
jgi:enediyne biosynthesis protein E4